jgi:hypothetical protein
VTTDRYTIETDLVEAPIATLTTLGDLTGDLVDTASSLAERLPMLGTAPPAVRLAERLRDAAGRTGLAGEVSAAEREVREFQRLLSDTRADYVARDEGTASAIRTAGGAAS